MQILGQTVAAVGSIDQGKLADYLHETKFKTMIGDLKFGPLGEWEKSRISMFSIRMFRATTSISSDNRARP